MTIPPLSPADTTLTTQLRAQLPQAAFRADPAPYNREPRGVWKGHAELVLAPGSTTEVATILAAANAARVPVIPYGGGTSLCGGQIMPDGPTPLVLTLERMNRIRSIDTVGNVATVEAGVVIEDLQNAALDADRLFPLSFGAQGSARVGGVLGTNAGGANVLRYGNARELCLGVEAVLADGRVMNTLTGLRKDNTGYDLRNLMIGSEGTLGVITAATFKLFPRPRSRSVALMVTGSPAQALDLLALARGHAGDGISAFELISGVGLDFLAETMPDTRRLFDPAPDWMVLVDLGLFSDAETVMETIFAEGFEAGLVSDGLISQNEAQAVDFWRLREAIPEANRLVGSISSHDISVPIRALPAFIDEGRAQIAALGPYRLNCFGHLGDGNLHYNVFPPKGHDRADYAGQKLRIMKVIHDLVVAYGGSISAEHGIGRLKAPDLARYGDPVKLEMMRGIKALFDPNGILNPGAVLT
ncbi:FAD-binding oxidoreductase [Pseudooceanicola algae]|uniref:Putative FAD-linked oxidoreductase n=1 Tax=Pseudooceanicola algae TaxID=1537215 RepID=A0A418SIG7_9RHOB|nr:FAD-binding oxidoreductase [Pseudooceanicola algae]QPM88965.1 putative FAD-linked oxidoreductase [Pseudooceanicola algae]